MCSIRVWRGGAEEPFWWLFYGKATPGEAATSPILLVISDVYGVVATGGAG